MFKQGLKPEVKTELMRTGASTENLDDLINTAIDIDVKLYELRQELREDPRARVVLTDKRPPPRNPWRNNNNFNRGQRGGRYQSNTGRRIHNDTSSGYYGPAAMDLSNINKGTDKWSKGKGNNKDKSKVVCYNCEKPGHFARDCRMKNKVVRQLNVLTTSDEGTGDEWEVLTDDMGRLMEDDYSGSDEDYIEYSDEDTTKDIDVRRAYDRSPTPYQEREPRTPPRGYPNARDSLIPIKIEEDGTRVYNTRGIHVGNHFMIDSPQLPVKHRTQSRENKTYSTHHFADALTSISTEDPQETKE